MKKIMWQNWSLMRGFRLMLGLVVMVQAFVQKDVAVGFLSAFLLFTAFANVGCCGTRNCSVKNALQRSKKEFEYEELDAGK